VEDPKGKNLSLAHLMLFLCSFVVCCLLFVICCCCCCCCCYCYCCCCCSPSPGYVSGCCCFESHTCCPYFGCCLHCCFDCRGCCNCYYERTKNEGWRAWRWTGPDEWVYRAPNKSIGAVCMCMWLCASGSSFEKYLVCFKVIHFLEAVRGEMRVRKREKRGEEERREGGEAKRSREEKRKKEERERERERVD